MLALGVPILQESIDLGGAALCPCPYKACQAWGLILAPEAPAGQGAR